MTGLPDVGTTGIGSAGLSVSKICFGTSALGDMPETYGYGVDADQAKATVRAVFDGPIHFLDTSRNYGDGRAEARIGEVIRERGSLPDGFVISTKLDRDGKTNGFDAARARRSLEESLEALGLDRVQLLHVHDPEYASDLSEVTRTGGAVDELFRMKEEGLVDAVGLAAGNVDIMMPILRNWDFDAIITHNRFTLLNRNAEKMIDFCVGKGTSVLNAAPYASGVLAKGTAGHARYVYQIPGAETLERIRAIEAICARHDVPIGAAALQFSMRDERIAATICGVSGPERIAQTLRWANWPVPDRLWEELAEVPYSRENPEAERGAP